MSVKALPRTPSSATPRPTSAATSARPSVPSGATPSTSSAAKATTPKPLPTLPQTRMVQTGSNAYARSQAPVGDHGLTGRPQNQPLERGNRKTAPKPLPMRPNVATGHNTQAQTGVKQQSAMKAPPGQIVNFGNSAKKDHKYDGGIVGKDGVCYSAKTDWNNVQGTQPNNGKVAHGKCIYVNGMNNRLDTQAKAMQTIANSTGAEVVGIHNSTHGVMRDIGECTKDKMNFGHNGAHKTLTDAVYNHVKNKPNEPLNIVAHSQGGIISSRALRDVRLKLRADDPNMTAQQAQQALKNVSVQTGGAAAIRYPSGPSYLHHVNKRDPIPTAIGMAATPHVTPSGISQSAPKKGEINTFSDPNARHGMNEVYATRMIPFDNMTKAAQL